MSRPLEEDNKERMEQIAEWVTKNRDTNKNRKARNRGLIHLGLAVLQMVEKGELNINDVQKHVVQNQTKFTNSLLQDAQIKRLVG